jgi:2-phospho-L-lactate guanylyltransferase
MADWRMADWVVVVPAKRLGAAKSRLRGAVDPARHEDLALAMVRDTVEAVRACVEVVQVLLVTDEPALITATAGPGVQAVADPGGGLNAAARFGADGWAGPGRRRAVLTGDLPGLRADDLTAALHAAGTTGGRAFVRDAAGTGTVLLTAGVGIALDPRFGAGSALAHARSGAHELAGDWPGLCRDVDTADDLWAVLGMGAGRHTCAVARDLGLTAGCRTG